jgi:hypothetical protein
MKTLRSGVVSAWLGFGLLSAGVAQTLLPPGASWEYTFAAPGTGWQTGAAAGVAWSTGHAPFSNCGPLGDVDCAAQGWPATFDANTRWPADTSGSPDDDLWVRTQVDLTGRDLGTLQAQWALGVDNGYKLYVNGTLLSQGYAEGFTDRWEYSGTVPASLLSPTLNWIAVALADGGGLTAFDMTLVTGQPPIPEPHTWALMLAATAAVSAVVRRKAVRVSATPARRTPA